MRLLIPTLLLLGLATAWGADGNATADSNADGRWEKPRAGARKEERAWTNRVAPGYLAVKVILPPGFEHTAVRFKTGDDPRWAEAGFDERGWEDITDRGLPTQSGVFWIRYRIRGPGVLPGGISQKVGAAFELYWDGKPIGRSGEPGNSREEEVPGKLDTYFSIPAEWLLPEGKIPWKIAKGAAPVMVEHVVAMRISNHRYGFPGRYGFPDSRTDLSVSFTTPERRFMETQQSMVESTLAAGAMSMVALMGLTLWLVALRRPLLLLFVGLCACAATTQFMVMARYLDGYNYDWHYPVRLGTVYLAGVLGTCLLGFVGVYFRMPGLRRVLLGYAVCFAAILFFPRRAFFLPLSEKSGIVMLLAFLLAAAIAGWAVWRKRRGAWLVLLGCASGILHGGRFTEGRFFPTIFPVMVGLAGAVALRLKDEAQAAEVTRMAAARLEVELLKKNLQPHFLLNSLTALAEVVERDPSVATKLIEDLAGVFRALARMSGEKQVSLAQELALCRAHLRVMSIRTEREARLVTRGEDGAIAVPPALFLTLIENGYIHQRVPAGLITFELAVAPVPDGHVFTFVSPGEVRRLEGRDEGGTGLRYVKARLEESYLGRWTFTHGPHPDGWRTVITLLQRRPV